jgi:hypothetical protein
MGRAGRAPLKWGILHPKPDQMLTALKRKQFATLLAVDRDKCEKAAPGCPVRGP